MRKGKLVKEKNLSKNSVDWERLSIGEDGVGRMSNISVKAYLDAHDMKTFCGLAEKNGNEEIAFGRGFPTIERAFAWAESRVDYKRGIVIRTLGIV